MIRNNSKLFFLIVFSIFCLETTGWSAEIAVIVNKENVVEDLLLRDLVKIFKMDKQYWNDGKRIYLIVRDSGEPAMDILLANVYQMKKYRELKSYWLAKIFQEEMGAFPKILSSNEATKRFVSQVPNAIGIVDASTVDSRVKVLRIDHKLPGEEGYALANGSPQG